MSSVPVVSVPSGYPHYTMPITARDLYQLTLCPCALYLSDYGPEEERAEVDAFVEYLMDLGSEYEQQVASELPHVGVPDGPPVCPPLLLVRFACDPTLSTS